MGMTKNLSTDIIDTGNVAATDALLMGNRALSVEVLVRDGMTLQAAIAATTESRKHTVGDILVCSWGYDQTNIDYYQVVGVTKSSVKIREILKTRLESDGSGTQDAMIPLPNRFDGEKTMTKRVRMATDRQSYSCAIESFASAYLWDGSPRYQTGACYGH